MGLKKINENALKELKFDVQSRFSEGDLEYVTPEDSRQLLNSFDSWHEYNHERNEE
jgi:hypothetical protein